MPTQAEVVLVILTLVMAVVAVMGHLLLGVLEWGERQLLALWGRRAVVRGPKQEHVRVPDPFRIAATARDRVERRQRQRAARAYVLAQLRDLVTRAE